MSTLVADQQAPEENSMALAGGVLGILALPMAIMFGWWLPFIVPLVAALGLALSGEGLRRVVHEGWPDKAWALVGVATAGLALALGLLGTAMQFSALL